MNSDKLKIAIMKEQKDQELEKKTKNKQYGLPFEKLVPTFAAQLENAPKKPLMHFTIDKEVFLHYFKGYVEKVKKCYEDLKNEWIQNEKRKYMSKDTKSKN